MKLGYTYTPPPSDKNFFTVRDEEMGLYSHTLYILPLCIYRSRIYPIALYRRYRYSNIVSVVFYANISTFAVTGYKHLLLRHFRSPVRFDDTRSEHESCLSVSMSRQITLHLPLLCVPLATLAWCYTR